MSKRAVALATLLVTCASGNKSSAEQPKPTPAVQPGDAATARLVHAAGEPQNWLTHGGTYLEQRFSPLYTINSDNINGPKLAWYYDLDTSRGQEATPLVVDGVLYTTTAWSKVKALDAVSGKLLWSYDPKVPPETGFKGCCDVVNRGAAYYDGKIYVGTFDGRLIALDAKTGTLIWSQETVDKSKPYTITGAPRVARGKVFIGNGGADLGVRGYVSAYDARNGKLVWRFYTVPGDPAKGPDHAASDGVLAAKTAQTWFGKF
jgi:PQQ-dependent dehydrogenase (methanol/ethanol family)